MLLFLCICPISSFSKIKQSNFYRLFIVKTNPAKSARNLAVIFNKNFTFRSHISAVGSSHVYLIRVLLRIYCHLDLNSAKLLAIAVVSSHLDYCNSLSYGITDTNLTKLQRIQNQLAHVVTKSPAFAFSIPLFHSLRWLPVKFSIVEDQFVGLQNVS